jgi:hypothetical protein
MDANSIVEYIRKNYPKLVFSPVKFADTNAIGFVISNNKLVVGFVNSRGEMCKLIEPVDLDAENIDLEDVVKKIPIVQGFQEKDKERLLKLFQKDAVNVVSKDEHTKAVNELKQRLQDQEAQYNVLFDSKSNEVLTVNKSSETKIQEIQLKYEEVMSQLEECKNTILNQKQEISDGIERYKQEVKDYMNSKDIKIEDLENMYQQMTNERDLLQAKLNELVEAEKSKLEEITKNKDLLSDYSSKVETKEQELEVLKKNIEDLTSQLKGITEELNRSKLREEMLQGYTTRCQQQLLEEKNTIIDKIKEYNEKWEEWAHDVSGKFSDYKKKLVNELLEVQKNMQYVIQQKNLSEKEFSKLKQNAKDIDMELKQTIANQIAMLNQKDEMIKKMKEQSDNEKEQDSKIIESLKNELQQVRELLLENSRTSVQPIIDYDSCYSTLQNFFALNNIFYRKQVIIGKLDAIVKTGNYLTDVPEETKKEIRARFEKVKQEIQAHISFLNIDKYANSPNFHYLKSKSTLSKVEPAFCEEIANILEYWNKHKLEYIEQDLQLTNIYEDVAGAVRVYVRIKPLIGAEQREKTLNIQVIDNKKRKSVNFDCQDVKGVAHNIKMTFGDFYGVFDDTYGNKDVYTGIVDATTDNDSLRVNMDEIIEASDTISPGLYSSFRQVEDGYSIVLMGYGQSGGGKSHTLIGTNGVPGVIHYGLSNMKDVSNIKLKYLFEQYYSAVDVNFGKVRGKIHNLVKEVPQLTNPTYSYNENKEFASFIPESLNLDNLKVEDITILTNTIEQYRVDHGRIKTTPNNKVSSRSHLYMVFEITFATGKTGYVTLIDNAGRESPIDIFNTFIDTDKTTLASVMAPPPVGGQGLIESTKRMGLDPVYNSEDILEILKEGFYINETLNHLVYYFNTKTLTKSPVIAQSTDITKYSLSKFYVSPKTEDKALNASNNCLTIPIMKFLDTLSNKKNKVKEFKPTKFIMLVMLRQEELYCDETYESLEFAQSIRSN